MLVDQSIGVWGWVAEMHCCYVGQTSGKLSGCGEQPLYKSYEYSLMLVDWSIGACGWVAERHCCYVWQTLGKLSGCGKQPLYKSYVSRLVYWGLGMGELTPQYIPEQRWRCCSVPCLPCKFKI